VLVSTVSVRTVSRKWLKNTNTCPGDRQACDITLVRRCQAGEVVRRVHVEAPRRQEENEVIDYFTRCEVCGESNCFYA
jgi:hypothetical protein